MILFKLLFIWFHLKICAFDSFFTLPSSQKWICAFESFFTLPGSQKGRISRPGNYIDGAIDSVKVNVCRFFRSRAAPSIPGIADTGNVGFLFIVKSGFLVVWIRTSVSMATNSCHTIIKGKPIDPLSHRFSSDCFIHLYTMRHKFSNFHFIFNMQVCMKSEIKYSTNRYLML